MQGMYGGPDYNPSRVMFGEGGGSSPYLPTSPLATTPSASSSGTGSNILGAESVRATGQGPFDSAYRQNLATYVGGNFLRPGGNLSFNPTDPNALMGANVGGGHDPVQGIGTSLLQQALGGQPFSFAQPPQQSSVAPQAQNKVNWRFWLDQFRNNGNMFRGAMR